MAVTGVAPARPGGSVEPNDLEDITHGCAQCGSTLTRTVRPLSGRDQTATPNPHGVRSPEAARRNPAASSTQTASPSRMARPQRRPVHSSSRA